MLLNKSKAVAYGGILTALGVIFIYLGTVLAYNKLAMLFFASLMIPIGILLIGTKYGIYIYISTLVLSLLLVGFREITLSYILFFGPYGIIKNYIEKMGKIPFEIILKLLYFNLALFISYKIYGLFISTPTNIQMPLMQIFILLQPVFLALDYVMTLFIHKFKKKYKT